MNRFSELSLCPQLRDNLVRNCFVEPTPVQAQAIPVALEGRDIVATAQTGTGKTLAFVLPIIEKLMTSEAPAKGVRAVVLTPTRELAIQISEVFATLAAGTPLKVAVVVGGMNEQRQLLALRQGAQVMVATPGRLCDFLDRRLVRMGGATTVVLDEADRMLDMGFLPSLKMIVSSLPAERQTLFFSATIDPAVAHLIEEYLKEPVRISVGQPTKPCEQVDLHVYEVEQDRKLGLLEHMLSSEQGSFLVFSRTKHGAERLSKKLSVRGVKSTAIHGDRTQNQRNQALRGFQQGHYRVLVATDVAARGIHVEGIGHVVNYDLPQAPEDFIHRVGRTGRAGARGTATTFSTRAERSEIRRIERSLKVALNRRDVPSDVTREDRNAVFATPEVAEPVVVSVPVVKRQRTESAAPRRSFGSGSKPPRRTYGAGSAVTERMSFDRVEVKEPVEKPAARAFVKPAAAERPYAAKPAAADRPYATKPAATDRPHAAKPAGRKFGAGTPAWKDRSPERAEGRNESFAPKSGPRPFARPAAEGSFAARPAAGKFSKPAAGKFSKPAAGKYGKPAAGGSGFGSKPAGRKFEGAAAGSKARPFGAPSGPSERTFAPKPFAKKAGAPAGAKRSFGSKPTEPVSPFAAKSKWAKPAFSSKPAGPRSNKARRAS